MPPRNPKPQKQKSKARAPPAALRGRSPRGRRLGEEHPSHQPGALGSFLGVKAKPLRGRCASLDPHPSDSAPQAPARASGVFSVKGGSRGWCGPQPRRGRGHGLTRPGDPSLPAGCRGRSSPGTPAPRRGPRQAAGRRIRRAVQGAPPAWGSRGAAPLGLRSEQNPLPKASIFCSSSFALRLFTAPRRGPKSKTEGEPRKATDNGALGFQCNH